jgi:hypothetical protein
LDATIAKKSQSRSRQADSSDAGSVFNALQCGFLFERRENNANPLKIVHEYADRLPVSIPASVDRVSFRAEMRLPEGSLIQFSSTCGSDPTRRTFAVA